MWCYLQAQQWVGKSQPHKAVESNILTVKYLGPLPWLGDHTVHVSTCLPPSSRQNSYCFVPMGFLIGDFVASTWETSSLILSELPASWMQQTSQWSKHYHSPGILIHERKSCFISRTQLHVVDNAFNLPTGMRSLILLPLKVASPISVICVRGPVLEVRVAEPSASSTLSSAFKTALAT